MTPLVYNPSVIIITLYMLNSYQALAFIKLEKHTLNQKHYLRKGAFLLCGGHLKST